MKLKQTVSVGISAVCLLAGCATTGGGDQFQNTVYDTHRRVVKLENTLEGTVTQLNETTATLTARVSENDEQTRRIGSLLEENQVRLDSLSRDFTDLKNTLYKRWNMGPATGALGTPGVEAETGTPVIEPPASALPPAPATGAPAAGSTVVAPPPAGAAPAPAAASGDYQAAYSDAQNAWLAGKYPEALQLFSNYLDKHGAANPENTAGAMFWRGRCYLKLEQYPQAIQEFEKVRAQYPNSDKAPSAMHNEAVAYARTGDAQKAEQILQEIVTNFPATTHAEEAKRTLEKLKSTS